MRTHNIPSCYRKAKRSLSCLLTCHYYQPSLARTTRLELIFMVPKVFEPMKFYCIYLVVLEGEQVSFCICKCCLPEKILDILVFLIYYAIIHASLMRSVHYSLP